NRQPAQERSCAGCAWEGCNSEYLFRAVYDVLRVGHVVLLKHRCKGDRGVQRTDAHHGGVEVVEQLLAYDGAYLAAEAAAPDLLGDDQSAVGLADGLAYQILVQRIEAAQVY